MPLPTLSLSLSLLTALLRALVLPLLFTSRILLLVFLTASAPLLHLGQWILSALAYPVHVLARLETLYIFFGVAALVGVVAGAGLHFGFGLAVAVLRLESGGEERNEGDGMGRGRRERREQREQREKGRSVGMGGNVVIGGSSAVGESVGRVEDGMKARVEGAYRRVEGVGGLDGYGYGEFGERKRGKGKGKERERERERESNGRRGRRGVMTSTILEEESSSEVGF